MSSSARLLSRPLLPPGQAAKTLAAGVDDLEQGLVQSGVVLHQRVVVHGREVRSMVRLYGPEISIPLLQV